MDSICLVCDCSDYDHFDWCTSREVKMPTNIIVKNTNQINQLKVTPETSEIDPKTHKKVWKAAVDAFVKPGDFVDVWVGGNQRVTIEELPT